MATEEPGAGGIGRGEVEKNCSGSVANCVSCSDGHVVLQSIIEPLPQASRPARPALDNLRFAIRQAFVAQPAMSLKLQPPTVEAFRRLHSSRRSTWSTRYTGAALFCGVISARKLASRFSEDSCSAVMAGAGASSSAGWFNPRWDRSCVRACHGPQGHIGAGPRRVLQCPFRGRASWNGWTLSRPALQVCSFTACSRSLW